MFKRKTNNSEIEIHSGSLRAGSFPAQIFEIFPLLHHSMRSSEYFQYTASFIQNFCNKNKKNVS